MLASFLSYLCFLSAGPPCQEPVTKEWLAGPDRYNLTVMLTQHIFLSIAQC